MPEENDLITRGRFEGEVLATLKSITEQLTDMRKRDDAFRIKIERQLEELEKKTDEAFASRDSRIKALEDWQLRLLGAGAVIVFVTSMISDFVFNKIQELL